MKKFLPGDTTDTDLCVALRHEFLRCHDAFTEFRTYASHAIAAGDNKLLSFRTYNAYSRFIHYLYEFMAGAYMREHSEIIKGDKVAIKVKAFISSHAQRVLTKTRQAIENGTAPPWSSDISAYPANIPAKFADDFRDCRNKIAGHVSFERSSLNLSEFYERNHLFLYMLYREAFLSWGIRGTEFPDLKQVTDFSVLLKHKPAQEAP
jgi:hypothetical protein